MLRILHLVSTFEIKTDTKWLYRLFGAVDRSKLDLSIGCFYDGGPMEQKFRALGVRTYNLQSPSQWDLRAVLQANRLIRSGKYQIVHTHLLRADLFGGIAARLAYGTRLISTAYALGQYRRANRRSSDRLLDRLTGPLPHHYIAVCDAIKQDLISRLKVKDEKITVIYTGIDGPITVDPAARDTWRKRWELEENQKAIIYVGRLSYEKGVEFLLEAAGQLRDRNLSFKCILVGSGPLEGQVVKQIKALNLQRFVNVVGFIDDVESAIWAADLLVMPSLSEGMPNVALEAFAVGTPVVASDVGGLAELGKLAPEALLLAQPANAGSLADKIEQIFCDNKLYCRCRDAANAIISKKGKLSAISAGREYETTYLGLFSRRG